MSECVFCKIVSGEIPSNKIYEDEKVMAFYDIAPKAPVHFLIIPKQHISGVDRIDGTNSKIISEIFETITKVAADLGVDSYRVVTNNGTQAGQTVFHLHFHVLGGGPLGDMA
ncbi:MAG TPA: histidine triad nucleotide-binding protein [Candidatus Avimonas sp.]|jgi:histidine triad (HIT) family protein|nr:histidine triad nucleotide-binding protein [Clostridiales bacterium]HOB36882.1 histidine triad nucleotide-binding protein [Candidatus Avimonas sp.]HQA16395.1 histidine triad nucleotide-binding protein [Candidatus Avimonas sp.]HQD37928.1 histidine triad nucleotide-binding protein [Candidatus Avimonas sp.]